MKRSIVLFALLASGIVSAQFVHLRFDNDGLNSGPTNVPSVVEIAKTDAAPPGWVSMTRGDYQQRRAEWDRDFAAWEAGRRNAASLGRSNLLAQRRLILDRLAAATNALDYTPAGSGLVVSNLVRLRQIEDQLAPPQEP
jgi:hypothetical protein